MRIASRMVLRLFAPGINLSIYGLPICQSWHRDMRFDPPAASLTVAGRKIEFGGAFLSLLLKRANKRFPDGFGAALALFSAMRRQARNPPPEVIRNSTKKRSWHGG
jgi:hypothetical protein